MVVRVSRRVDHDYDDADDEDDDGDNDEDKTTMTTTTSGSHDFNTFAHWILKPYPTLPKPSRESQGTCLEVDKR